MPIFDQGYQHWNGELSSHAWRWLTIARQGVRAQLGNRGTRMLVLAAWVPALALAAAMVLWGLLEQKSALVTPFLQLLQGLPEEVREGPKNFRVMVWTYAFEIFLGIEQFFTMLLVLFVGPNLISQDLRFNAVPLYLSRPLRRIDYFAGKLGVIGAFLAAVAIFPILIAYVLGIAFSLDFSVIPDTARILGGSLLYAVVVVVSAGTLMLALSSLSRNSRYVGAMWIGIWIVSGAVSGILTASLQQRWCPLVSYQFNLQLVAQKLIDTSAARKGFEELVDTGRKFGSGGMQPGFRPGRQPRGFFAPPHQQPPEKERARDEMAELLETVPVSWAAGVLTGLFGLSVATLSLRVRSLDRLK